MTPTLWFFVGCFIGWILAQIALVAWSEQIFRFLDNTLGKIWPFNKM